MKKLACIVLAATTLFAAQALAQTTHSIYLDTDADPSTGCTISTPSGDISGVEVGITATVDNTPAQIMGITRSTCENGQFSAPQTQPSDYGVRLNQGINGSDALEFSAELAGLGTGGPATAYFVSGNALGETNLVQAAIELPGITEVAPQDAVPVPITNWLSVVLIAIALLWFVRKYPRAAPTMALVLLVSVTSGTWATRLAGAPAFDWSGYSPLATGGSGHPTDGNENVGIVAVFVATNSTQLFVRFDIQDLEATPNQAPSLEGASVSLLESRVNGDAIYTALGSDPDADQVLSYAITEGNAGGAFSIDPSTGVLSLADRSQLNFQTTTSVALTISVTDNGTPARNASAVVTINLVKVNHAPSFTKGEDQTVDMNADAVLVPAWATEITDNDQGTQEWTFSVTNDNPELFAVAPSVDANGNLQFTPALDSYGVATVTVVLQDNGGVSDGGADSSISQTFMITVTQLFPTAVADAATLEQDSEATAIDVLANDDNPYSSALSVVAVTQPANGTVLITGAGAGLTYEPNPDFFGTDTFTYEVQHQVTGTVTVTVTRVNKVPSLNDASFSVFENSVNGFAIGTVLGSDPDSDQQLTYAITAGNTGGAFLLDPSTGVLSLLDSSQLDFQVATSVPLTISVTDNGMPARDASATVTINLVKVNHAPSFVKGMDQTVDMNAGAVLVPAWATGITDNDQGTQELLFLLTSDMPELFAIAPVVDANGNLQFTPALDSYGVATLTVVLQDNGGVSNGGADSSSQTFTITVTQLFPTVAADSATLDQDSAATVIDVLANDSTPYSSPLSVVSVTQPANGAVVNTGSGVIYQPNPDFFGTDTFTYEVQHGVTGTVTVSVSRVNKLPSLNSMGFSVFENSANGFSIGTVQGSDPDADQTLTYAITAGNEEGAFSIDADSGVLNLADISKLNFQAAISLPLMITVSDNGVPVRSASAIFTIELVKVNHAPSFTAGPNQTVNMNAGAVLVPAWATGITDNDQDTQDLLFLLTSDMPELFAIAPVVDANGDLQFTPADDAYGTATVTVMLQDNGGVSNGGADSSISQTFMITVTQLFPTAVADAATLEQDSEATAIDVLANDINPYIGALVIVGVSQPENGTVAITGDGTGLTYQPGAGFTGEDTFTYTVLDGVIGTVTVTVEPASATTDVGAFQITGSCGTLGLVGPGFTLKAGPTQPLPVGTTIVVNGSGIANIGVFSVSGGLANVAVLSPTARQITLTQALPAGATIAFRTTLSISVAFQLNAVATLPPDYVGTGSKSAGAVSSTLVLCSAT